MTTLRLTQPLLRRLGGAAALPAGGGSPEVEHRLAEWSLAHVDVAAGAFVLALNHESYLTLLVPLCPPEDLRPLLTAALVWQLRQLAVADDVTGREARALLDAAFARSSDRHVLGSLADLKRHTDAELEGMPPGDRSGLMAAQDRLNDMPHVQLDHPFPKDNVRARLGLVPVVGGRSVDVH